MLLEQIQKANDIKSIDKEDYGLLAQEIREFLIEKISVTGGHLGPNLGTVELTMALHLSLDLPKDKIIWDVGHQSYTHKLLTGRREGFDTLRKFGGMSGFPKRKESDCDSFDTGHSSTSISAGLGMVKARDIRGEDYTVVSVIGDGALGQDGDVGGQRFGLRVLRDDGGGDVVQHSQQRAADQADHNQNNDRKNQCLKVGFLFRSLCIVFSHYSFPPFAAFWGFL